MMSTLSSDTPYSITPIQVVLAEFDIDKGSCIRARFPECELPCHVASSPHNSPARSERGSAQDTWDHYLADQMLPDGAEKHAVSKTTFLLNRPHTKSKLLRLRAFVFVHTSMHDPQRKRPGNADAAAPVRHAPDTQHPTIQSESAGGDAITWSRLTKALPDAFLSEVLTVDPYSGAMEIKDRYGDVIAADVAAQEHVFTRVRALPEPVALFALRRQAYSDGGVWEDVTLPSADTGAMLTPTLVPSPQAAASSFPGEPSASTFADTTKLPYVFLTVGRTSGAGSTDRSMGILLRDTDFTLFASRQSTEGAESPVDGNGSGDVPLPVEDTLVFNTSVPFVPQFEFPTETTQVCLSAVCAAVTRKDAAVRRGGINKSVAIIGPSLAVLAPLFPLLVETAEKCCEVRGNGEAEVQQQTAILARAFEAAAAAIVSVVEAGSRHPIPQLNRRVLWNCAGDQSTATRHVRVVGPFVLKHTMAITALETAAAHPSTDSTPLTKLAEGLKEQLFVLMSAILCRQRIVVYSRSLAATDVCDAVLALGSLGQAVDPLFVAQRVFPYTSINHMSLFEAIPGFVVGTLNPMFETQATWWDVMLDLDASTLTTSGGAVNEMLGCGDAPCTHGSADKDAAKELARGIVHLRAMRASAGEVEAYVRDFMHEAIRSTVVFAQFASPSRASSRVLPRNFVANIAAVQRSRVEAWMVTDMHDAVCAYATTKESELFFLVACLRRCQGFEDFELVQLVQEILRSVHSDADVILLLSMFPLSLGGLAPLAAKMLHGSLAVRMTVIALLRKIESCDALSHCGTRCLTKLNSFLMNAYEALNKELPDTSMAY